MTTAEYWTSDHVRDLAEMVTGFAGREILPYQDAWERDGRLPRELHRKAGALGLLGASFPQEVGGEGGDMRDSVVICESLHNAGVSGGVFAPELQPAFYARMHDFWIGSGFIESVRRLMYFPDVRLTGPLRSWAK